MNLGEFFGAVYHAFPLAHVSEDLDGEIIIHTGLIWEAPFGFQGYGPQNIPDKVQPTVELREMNEGDLPDAKI
jgi:hypothetical protein|tara:strand:+ start:389 stop:607 length:219 start_codon:yes stop_codon:yes gene_type:complete